MAPKVPAACALQQEIHHQLSRNPDRHQVAVARRTRKTRSQRGYESGHQIYQQQVRRPTTLSNPQTALLGATKCHESKCPTR